MNQRFGTKGARQSRFRTGAGNTRRGPSARRETSRGASGNRIDISQLVRDAVPKAEKRIDVDLKPFSQFGLHEKIYKNLTNLGYKHPTPIQNGAIGHVLRGCDVVGIANTGTGKTAAFLLPLLDNILRGVRSRVLIIVPTRELAQQIDVELKKFAQGLGIGSAVCIGGAGMGGQIKALESRPRFVIGTPGRLKDFSGQKRINYAHFDAVVLDEVDRMLDMGFVTDIRFLISLMPKERQSLFFSATLPREISELMGSFLKNPVKIEIRTRPTSENVAQNIVRLQPGEEKLDKLHEILIQPDIRKALIFGRTKHGVEKLAKKLLARGFRADAIHGNKSQGKRTRALDGFRHGSVKVLVATDVAARGLDIPDISHVINYDMPNGYEDYIHRIGRTGRGSEAGVALTFVE